MLLYSVITIASLLISAPDPSLLTPPQRAVYQRVIGEEFCSCDSTLTISGCVQHKKACRTGGHLATLVHKQASSNTSADEILAMLATQVVGPMCGKATQINIAGAPIKGAANAPITLVEFADFRCTHCRHAAPEIKRVIEAHKGQVRLVFMPFPLGDHPHSTKSAEAVLEAAAQGKFEVMHDALMHSATLNFDRDTLVRTARAVGLDIPRFIKALDSGIHKELRQRLKGEGVRVGVAATPAMYINGRPFIMTENSLPLADRIDMELERMKGTCK